MFWLSDVLLFWDADEVEGISVEVAVDETDTLSEAQPFKINPIRKIEQSEVSNFFI